MRKMKGGKMNKLNILFVCKYNRFRSRIAEAYFNKVNRDKKIRAKSGGIMVGAYPLDKQEVSIAKKFGILLKGKPEPVTTEKLIWQDIIIIVADNVPKYLFDFNENRYKKKTIVWKIPDIKHGESTEQIKRIIKMIIKRVDELVNELR
jgi:protein-tyrosine-phosphatase